MNSQIEYHMPYDSHGKIQIASPFFLLLAFGTLLGQGLLGFVLVTIESNVNSGLESTTVSTNVDPTTMTTTTESTMSLNTAARRLKTTTEMTIPTATTTI